MSDQDTAVEPPSERASLMRTYADPPATFVRGQGTLLYDEDGAAYLDFITGLAVVSLGHAHPAVADAVAEQARTLSHVSNLYGNTLAPEVARTIDRLINGGQGQAGGQVFFANSGAEANECALKLARRWAGVGRHVVISADNAFHGRTLATLTATGQPEKQAPFVPLPEGFVHVPYDDVAALDEALDPATVAAVLLEPLQGEGGVMVPSSDYLGAVRSLCTERNALLMLDEVQTGLGRTGHWFAFQAQGLEPDVVTMAKALGNGMPVGACWARAEVAAAFGPGDHGSTFGGQPLALAAVKATLAVMESEDVCRRAREGGERLASGLAQLPGVVSVRGAGLLLAAQLDAPVAKEAAAEALVRGLLVNPVRPDAIRVAPPLLVRDDEIDSALGILGAALTRPAGTAPAPAGRRDGGEGPARAQLLRHRRPRPRGLGAPPGARPRTARGARPGGPGRGAALPEAVGPDPQLHRDGGGRPGRAPRLHPGDRGRPGRARDGRGRGPHARLLPPHPLRPRLRALDAGAHGRRAGPERLRRPGGQPPLRHRAPVPGGGRRAHHARGARFAGRPRPGLCRRRQQHGALAGRGGTARRDGGPLRQPGRLRLLRRRPGPAAGLRRPRGTGRQRAGDRRPRPGRQGRRRPVHRRLDEHGPGGGAGRTGSPPSPATPSTRPWSSRRPPMPSSCTASRRTAARRSPTRCSRGRARWSGARRPTGARPCAASWPGCSRDPR